jgi:hypothetical protein
MKNYLQQNIQISRNAASKHRLLPSAKRADDTEQQQRRKHRPVYELLDNIYVRITRTLLGFVDTKKKKKKNLDYKWINTADCF